MSLRRVWRWVGGSDLNVQFTLSAEEVNMSTAPNLRKLSLIF